MNLREIGKSMYGTKYVTYGIFKFNSIDYSDLKWRDIIKDNGNKGMNQYANECSSCKGIFLNSTLILVSELCDRCHQGE